VQEIQLSLKDSFPRITHWPHLAIITQVDVLGATNRHVSLCRCQHRLLDDLQTLVVAWHQYTQREVILVLSKQLMWWGVRAWRTNHTNQAVHGDAQCGKHLMQPGGERWQE
jgi:hypothetical protein